MPVRAVRSDEELHQAASHVDYEVKMLYYASQFLGQTHSSPPLTFPSDFQNMALEVLLLHYRCLRAFLCPSIQGKGVVREDDMLASDFLDEGNPRDLADALQTDLR